MEGFSTNDVPEPAAHETISSQTPKIRKLRVGRIAGGGTSCVWTYFTKNPEKTSTCTLCKVVFKHQNPGNLSKHLHWSHPAQFAEFKQETDEKRKAAGNKSNVAPSSSGGIQTTLNFAPQLLKQQTKCYKKDDLRYKKRTAAVTRLFVANSISRRIVDSSVVLDLYLY